MAFLQSKSLWVREFATGVAVLQLDPPGKSVRLPLEFIAELDAALESVAREPNFRLLVVRSLKPGSFCQGPDVAQWRAMSDSQNLSHWIERGQNLWNRLLRFELPTVAWVQGACLGAGLEIALACDRLVAVDRPGTVLGFNELDIGLLPSWGSLGLLPRRIGLERTFPLVLAGRR